MTRLRAWILRWLGGVSVNEVLAQRAAASSFVVEQMKSALVQMREECRLAILKSEKDQDAIITHLRLEHDKQMVSLIKDLEAVRDSIPRLITENGTRVVRRLPSWASFRGAVEQQPKKIPIERQN